LLVGKIQPGGIILRVPVEPKRNSAAGVSLGKVIPWELTNGRPGHDVALVFDELHDLD
jgi:hypothetical protein